MVNLIDDPKLADIKNRLSRELDHWMNQQGDPGIPQDTREALQASRQDRHLYGPHKKK